MQPRFSEATNSENYIPGDSSFLKRIAKQNASNLNEPSSELPSFTNNSNKRRNNAVRLLAEHDVNAQQSVDDVAYFGDNMSDSSNIQSYENDSHANFSNTERRSTIAKAPFSKIDSHTLGENFRATMFDNLRLASDNTDVDSTYKPSQPYNRVVRASYNVAADTHDSAFFNSSECVQNTINNGISFNNNTPSSDKDADVLNNSSENDSISDYETDEEGTLETGNKLKHMVIGAIAAELDSDNLQKANKILQLYKEILANEDSGEQLGDSTKTQTSELLGKLNSNTSISSSMSMFMNALNSNLDSCSSEKIGESMKLINDENTVNGPNKKIREIVKCSINEDLLIKPTRHLTGSTTIDSSLRSEPFTKPLDYTMGNRKSNSNQINLNDAHIAVELEATKYKLASAYSTIDELKQLVAAQSANLRKSLETLEITDKEKQAIKLEYATTAKHLTEAQEEIKRFEKELNLQTLANNELKATLKDTQDELVSLSEKLNNEITSQKLQIQQFDMRILELQNINEKLKHENSCLQKDIVEIISCCRNYKNLLNQFKLKKLRHSLSVHSAGALTLLPANKQSMCMKGVQTMSSWCHNDCDSTSAQHKELELLIIRAAEDKQVLEKDIAELRRIIDSQNDEISELKFVLDCKRNYAMTCDSVDVGSNNVLANNVSSKSSQYNEKHVNSDDIASLETCIGTVSSLTNYSCQIN